MTLASVASVRSATSPALITAGLVDEYRLLTSPIVVNVGQRLFDATGTTPLGLEPIEATPFASDVVLLRYQPI